MDAREVLIKYRNEELSLEEAELYFRREPFEELEYAKLDTHRKLRSGFAEVVFCSGKADEHLLSIFRRLYEEEGEVFGTRASQQQYELVKESAAPGQLRSRFPDPEDRKGRKGTHRKDRRVYGGNGGYSGGGGGGADRGIFRKPCGAHLRRGGERPAPADVPAGADPERQLRGGRGRDGGGAGQRAGRPGGESRAGGSHLRGLWGQHARPVGPSDHDQFLCQRHRRAQH